MSDSLDEKLKAIDKERDQIIHEGFIAEQQKIDEQMQKATDHLQEKVNDEGSKQNGKNG